LFQYFNIRIQVLQNTTDRKRVSKFGIVFLFSIAVLSNAAYQHLGNICIFYCMGASALKASKVDVNSERSINTAVEYEVGI